MQVDPFDFLRKGEANLTKASSYLKTNGYRIQWLAQPDRYVVGRISKSRRTYFFKMASRPGLSLYIENEFAWSQFLSSRYSTRKWPISVPQVYTFGRMGGLSWLAMEYIEGV